MSETTVDKPTTHTVVVENPSGVGVVVDAPPHPAGGKWGWELVTDSERAYSDSPDGLLDFLYPGYIDLNDDEQWTARYMIAVLAQVHAQAAVNSRHEFTRLTPAQKSILTGPRHGSVMTPTWDCVIPLVLIRTDYSPATDVPAPQPSRGMAANVWWIDPSDAYVLLVSLHEVGYVTVNVAAQ